MGQAEQTNEPLDESDIKEVFSGLLGNSRAPKVSLSHITPQITMLYYVLLYENVRLLHMRSIVLSQRKVKIYSKDLLSDLPVKLLVKAAEREQEKLGSLFPQLLKLCSSQFPHLCFVQDWLMVPNNSTLIMSSRLRVTEAECKEALEAMTTCPAKLTLVILKLLQWSPMDAWAFVDLFVGAIHKVLHSNVPRKVRGEDWKIRFPHPLMFQSCFQSCTSSCGSCSTKSCLESSGPRQSTPCCKVRSVRLKTT